PSGSSSRGRDPQAPIAGESTTRETACERQERSERARARWRQETSSAIWRENPGPQPPAHEVDRRRIASLGVDDRRAKRGAADGVHKSDRPVLESQNGPALDAGAAYKARRVEADTLVADSLLAHGTEADRRGTIVDEAIHHLWGGGYFLAVKI